MRRRDPEVGEEARVVPVRDAGQQHAIEVGEHVRERLGLLGRRRRQPRADLARLDRRHHGPLADALEVVGRPVDGGVAVGAELLRIRHAREASVRPRSVPAAHALTVRLSRRDAHRRDGDARARRAADERRPSSPRRRASAPRTAGRRRGPSSSRRRTPSARRAGRGHDRAGAVRRHRPRSAVDRADLARSAPPTTPAASLFFVTARASRASTTSRRPSRSSTPSRPRPSAARCRRPVPDDLSCPARAAERHEQREAGDHVGRRHARRSRLMLPPCLVVAYRIWGDRHSFFSR